MLGELLWEELFVWVFVVDCLFDVGGEVLFVLFL